MKPGLQAKLLHEPTPDPLPFTSTVKNRYRGTTHYIHVLAELVRAAQYRGVATRQDIAVITGLPIKGAYMGAETGWVPGEIAEDEVAASPPMLSAALGRCQRQSRPRVLRSSNLPANSPSWVQARTSATFGRKSAKPPTKPGNAHSRRQ
jgi:hypothetical protein